MIDKSNINYKFTRLISKKSFLSFWVNEDLKKIPENMEPKIDYIEFLSKPVVLFLILILPSLLMVAIGYHSNDSSIFSDISIYLNIAAILASLIVIVIMVIVFMLEINRLSVPGASNLLYIIARYNFYLPTIAWVMGTIISGILFPFISEYYISIIDGYYSRLGFIIISITSILFLFQLSISFLSSLGSNYLYEQLANALLKKHRLTFRNLIGWRKAYEAYIKKIEEIGYSWNYWNTPLAHQKAYSVNVNARLFDIDLTVLEELRGHINNNMTDENSDIMLTICPGELLNESGKNVLLIPKSLEVNDENIKLCIKNCFIYTNTKSVTESIWEELSSLLIGGMRSHDISVNKKSLQVFFNVVKDYLEMVDAMNLEYIDPYSFEVSIHNYLPPSIKLLITEYGFIDALNSNIKLNEFVLFIRKVVIEIWKHNNLEYLKETLAGLCFLYREVTQSVNNYYLNSTIIIELIHGMYVNTIGFKLDYVSVMSLQKPTLKKIDHLIPYSDIFLRANLTIARRALENGNIKDLHSALDNFLINSEKTDFSDIRKYYLRQFDKYRKSKSEDSEKNVIKLSILYGYIKVRNSAHLAEFALYAWGHYLIKQGYMANSDILDEINEIVIEKFEGLNGLVNLLLFRGISHERNELVDDNIGYGSWDYRNIKPLIIHQRLDPEDWLIDYLICLALRASIADDFDEKSLILYEEVNEYDYGILLKRIEDFNEDHCPIPVSEIGEAKRALINLLEYIKQLHFKDSYQAQIKQRNNNI